MSTENSWEQTVRTQIRPTKHWDLYDSKLFDTLIVFLKDLFENINFEKTSTTDDKKIQYAKI